MGEPVKQKNRRMRQENLRDQLAAGGHVQHVLDIADKLLDLKTELEPIQVQRYKIASDIKSKIIDKYLSTIKHTEMEVTGRDGEPLYIPIVKRFDGSIDNDD